MSNESFRKFGPKSADHPSIGVFCPGCQQPFKAGDYTTLVAIGPGDDPDARRHARKGRAFNAIAVEAHWDCVTGGADPKDIAPGIEDSAPPTEEELNLRWERTLEEVVHLLTGIHLGARIVKHSKIEAGAKHLALEVQKLIDEFKGETGQ